MSQSLPKPSILRVAMAKRVAEKWLAERTRPEIRLTVFEDSGDRRNLQSLLRAFRDKRANIEGIPPIPDLGVRVVNGNTEVWSTNHEGMVALNTWLTKIGCETTGVW